MAAQETGGITIPGSVKKNVDVPVEDMIYW